MKVNILRANFTIQADCPIQNYFSHQLWMQRKKFNTQHKWRSSQLSQKPASKQAVKETTFPDNLIDCTIINLWNKQTVLIQNFFQRIHRGSKARKPKKNTNYNINVFFEFTEFLGEVGSTRKITNIPCVQTRIKCSVVSTPLLFEEAKLSMNTSSLPYS